MPTLSPPAFPRSRRSHRHALGTRTHASGRLAGVVAVLATLGFTTSALAAPPKASSIGDRRGYVYLSPGLFAVPVGDDDVTDAVDLSYQWGLGVGGMFRVGPKGGLAIAPGFAFEHSPTTLDEDLRDFCDLANAECSIQVFRLLPEVRLGGVRDRFYGYGLLGMGLGLVHGRFDTAFINLDDEDTDAGFNLAIGGGAQYMVWRQLFVGGELGFDLGFYSNDEEDFGNDDYGAYTLDLKAMVGWYF